METAHLASLGARTIPRREFIAALNQLATDGEPHGKWPLDEMLHAFRGSAT